MQTQHRLKELRKEKGFSRKSFAKHLGIPVSTLRNYELSIHEPCLDFLISVSQIFDVSMEYLLGVSNERINYSTGLLTEGEIKLIEQYRNLDTHGKNLIKRVLEHELERCMSNE